jgi:hypothetical protein
MHPRPGDYGVVGLAGILPWVVSWATDSWANHAFIVGYDDDVIEAWPGGIRHRALSDFAGLLVTFSSEGLSGAQGRAIVDCADSLLGHNYDYAALLSHALRITTGIDIDMITRLLRFGGFLCTQLVLATGLAAGVDRTHGIPPAHVTPAILAEDLPAPSRWER